MKIWNVQGRFEFLFKSRECRVEIQNLSRQTYDVSLILVILIRGDSNLAKKGREKDARNRDTRR